MIHIHFKEVGDMNNLVYILVDQETGKSAVVDPAWDMDFIQTTLKNKGKSFDMILLTHTHFDHINKLEQLLSYKEVPVYVSGYEKDWIPCQVNQLKFSNSGDRIHLGESTIHVFHTGHSPGGLCFYVDHHLISGDTLFIDGCGRCSFQGSDPYKMYESLQLLKTLPDETIIYPGHHYGSSPTDTLEMQKQSNRYLTAPLEVFLRKRMGKRT